MGVLSLKKGEQIHATLHQSGLVYFWSLLIVLVFYTATSYFLFWLLERGVYGQVVIGVGYTFATLKLMRIIIFLRGNKLVVTNSRIIDVYKPKLFSRVVTQIKMSDVTDVTVESHGFLDTITRLGGLAVEGNDMRVVFRHARGVDVLQDAILELKRDTKKGEAEESPRISTKQMLERMEGMHADTLSALLEEAMKILKEKKEI